MELRKVFVVALLASLVLPIAVFASGGAEPASATSAPLNVSIAHWDIDKSITGAPDAVYDWVKQKVGIAIKPVAITSGDYNDKIQVWAASGELPDAFFMAAVGTQIFQNWVTNGIIQPLPGDLSKYPRVKAIVSVSDVQAYQVEGKNWFIPRPNYQDPSWWANDRGVLVRTDWMKKLGLSMPKTDADFTNLMVAFATKDPDGNGVNDTVGLTTKTVGFLWGAFMNDAPDLAWPGWTKQDGKWVATGVSREAFSLYSAIRKLYQAGGLDRDFAALKKTDGINKFASGKAGAIAHQVSAKHWYTAQRVWDKLHPEIDFGSVTDIIPERLDANGQRWRFKIQSFWSETYLNAKADKEKVDAILRLTDLLLSDEFGAIAQWGFESVDSKKGADGKMQSLLGTNSDGTPKQVSDKYPFLYSMSYFAGWGDDKGYQWPWISPTIRSKSTDHLQWALNNAKAPDIPWKLNAHAPSLASFPRVHFDDSADMVNFALSPKSPDAAWQDIIDKYNGQGYQQLEKEMNDYAKSIGM